MRWLVLAAALTAAVAQVPALRAQEAPPPPALAPLTEIQPAADAPVEPPDASVQPPVAADPGDGTGPSEDRLSVPKAIAGEASLPADAAQQPVGPDTPVEGGTGDPTTTPDEPTAAPDVPEVAPDEPATTTPDVQEPDEEEFGVGFDDQGGGRPDESAAHQRPAAAAAVPAPAVAVPAGSLPTTGLDLAPFALLGVALLMAGSGLRGMTARP
jgi:hypothetical protein